MNSWLGWVPGERELLVLLLKDSFRQQLRHRPTFASSWKESTWSFYGDGCGPGIPKNCNCQFGHPLYIFRPDMTRILTLIAQLRDECLTTLCRQASMIWNRKYDVACKQTSLLSRKKATPIFRYPIDQVVMFGTSRHLVSLSSGLLEEYMRP